MPLSNLTILGKALIEYWLEHLVTLGAREVHLLASDRPEQVRRLVGNGERWGLQVTVHPELRELTPAEARAKYRTATDPACTSAPHDITLVDHLPALPEFPLFTSYAAWFAALATWLNMNNASVAARRRWQGTVRNDVLFKGSPAHD